MSLKTIRKLGASQLEFNHHSLIPYIGWVLIIQFGQPVSLSDTEIMVIRLA